MRRTRISKKVGDRKSYHIQASGSRFCPTPAVLSSAVLALLKERPDVRLWLLSGNLGAGKTTAVRRVVQFLVGQRRVVSPTYILRQEFPISWAGYRRLVHVDAYRLKSSNEAAGIGLLDDLDDKHCLLWIEWPEQLAGLQLPAAALLRIEIKNRGRQFTWTLPTEAPPGA